MDSFLNSALNIEYVYLILQGINFMLDQGQNLDPKSMKIKILSNQAESRITFNEVKIDYADDWNVRNTSFDSNI